MRLKGELADEGISLLVQSCLPPLEKVEREIILMFTKENVFLFAKVFDSSSLQATATIPIPWMFMTFYIESKARDRIAFSIDSSQLISGLQSFIKLARYEEGHVQMKLGRKATPYLMFEAKRTENARLIVQEVPVSKPLSSNELDELEGSLNVGEIATYIQLPELRFFSQMVDNLANLAKSLHIVVSKDRRLFLTALDSTIQIGAEFKQLEVVGETVSQDYMLNIETSAERLKKAREDSISSEVVVSSKHLLQCLHCHKLEPDKIIAAVVGQGDYFIIACQRNSSAISENPALLQYKLPVHVQ